MFTKIFGAVLAVALLVTMIAFTNRDEKPTSLSKSDSDDYYEQLLKQREEERNARLKHDEQRLAAQKEYEEKKLAQDTAKLAQDTAKRKSAFDANRAAIIAKIRALSRAGKWGAAYNEANEYYDVEDAELQRLMKTADDKVSAEVAADAKAKARVEALLARTQRLHIGMTKQQVLDSGWGRPDQINRTLSVYGDREQWVYGLGNYLYFDGNVLTTIQTSDR